MLGILSIFCSFWINDLFTFYQTFASGFLPRGWKRAAEPLILFSDISSWKNRFCLGWCSKKSQKCVESDWATPFQSFHCGEIFLVYFFGGFHSTTICLISEFFSSIWLSFLPYSSLSYIGTQKSWHLCCLLPTRPITEAEIESSWAFYSDGWWTEKTASCNLTDCVQFHFHQTVQWREKS